MSRNIQFVLERADVEIFRDLWAWNGAADWTCFLARRACGFGCVAALWIMFAQSWPPTVISAIGLGVLAATLFTSLLLRESILRRLPRTLYPVYIVLRRILSGVPTETGRSAEVGLGEEGITFTTDMWEAFYAWGMVRAEFIAADDVILVRVNPEDRRGEAGYPVFLIPARAFRSPEEMDAFLTACALPGSASRPPRRPSGNAGDRRAEKSQHSEVAYWLALTTCSFMLWWLVLVLSVRL